MQISSAAKKILVKAIIIDAQLAFELAIPWSFTEKWALVDRYKQAGFHALTLSIANEENTLEETLKYLSEIRKYIFLHPHKYLLARTRQDILQAKHENKIALRLMFQGAGPIGNDLNLLEMFQHLGISSLIVSYNIRNLMGDGVIEENDAGLSHLGKKFIQQMNRLGLIIDISHTGVKTSLDAAMLTQKPILASHSATYSINPHLRNLNGAQIKAIARTGGVVGINGIGTLLGSTESLIESYVTHLSYVVKLVGINHVAVGLDNLYFANQFNEFMQNQRITHPEAYQNKAGQRKNWSCLQPEDLISVVQLLLENNCSPNEIQQIFGGNILRLIENNFSLTANKRCNL